MEHGAPAHDDLRRALDREVDLVDSAIDLVATGGAPSATIAGLRLTDAVLDIVRPRAARLSVRVEPLWGPDETTCDVRVSRATAG
jgi:hypothetical protein